MKVKNKKSIVSPGHPRSGSAADLESASPHLRYSTTFLVLALILSVATMAAYIRVLDHEFLYLDDRAYVTENQMVQKGLSWEGIRWAFSTVHAANWHPLTWLSHMLDSSLFGLDPSGHHLTSVLLHTVNVVLLFTLLFRLTGQPWASAFVAGAFGLHPTHVESVAWVAERKDVLSTMLGLVAAIAYVRYAEKPGFARYALILGALALSLMAKPMMVTLPFVFLLLDYWPLNRVHRGWLRLFLEKLPLITLAGVSSAITVYAQRAGGAMMTQAMVSTPDRILNAIVSYAKYIWITVWPANLAVYYPHPLKPPPMSAVVASLILLLGVTALVLALRRKHRFLEVGWFWFLGTLVPVIGLVQVGGQAMADRYTYVPTIGLFVMAAWSGVTAGALIRNNYAALGPASPKISVVRGMGTAILTVLGICTVVQAGYWHNDLTLYQRAIDVVPNNAQAHIFMANSLIRRGRLPEAVPHFGRAVQIFPNEPYNLTDYGHALLDNGQIDDAALALEEAVRLKPDFADAHYFLGLARLGQNRPAEGARHLNAALAANPDFTGAHLYLGHAYFQQAQWPQAVKHYQKWLEVEPESMEASVKLAQAYYSMGNAPAAILRLQKVAQANPAAAYPRAVLGQLEQWEGGIPQAMAWYEDALRIDPHYADAGVNLALILATHPDKAIRNGTRALELAKAAVSVRGGRDPAALDALAASYAELGRYEEAMEIVDRALEAASSSGSTTMVANLQKRRAAYSAGNPARSMP